MSSDPPCGLRTVLVMLLVDDRTEIPLARVDARRVDLALVDALLRLEMWARHHGWAVRLRDVTDELCALLDLVGVSGVLRLEPRREAELREQLGIEEVLQPRDPPV